MSALRIAAIADDSPVIPNAKPEDAGSADTAKDIAKFCREEADALRGIFKCSGSSEPARAVLQLLYERLKQARHFDLAARIDTKDFNPSLDSVLSLLSQIRQSLEDFAARGATGATATQFNKTAKTTIQPEAFRGASPEPDGPELPDKLRFNGQEIDVEPIPLRLIDYMWNRDKAKIDAVCASVWGEKGDADNANAFKAAQRRANRSLSQLRVPWRISTKQGYVSKKSV
jgi:hypothetical protein